MAETSGQLLDKLREKTSTIVSTLAASGGNTLEFLENQQRLIHEKLQSQELLNSKLYESLLKSGIIDLNDNVSSGQKVRNILSSTPVTKAAKSIFDLLNHKSELNENNLRVSQTSTFSPLHDLSRDRTTGQMGNTGMASMLPLGHMVTNLNSIFEKLFGTKFWIYALIAILAGLLFTFIACFCMYCCCCSRIGRTLMCCCKCSGFDCKKSKKSMAANNSRCLKCCI